MVEREGDRLSTSKGATQSPSMKPNLKSPLLPLAPLEYLQQNQRRGSITDPSLHAAPLVQRTIPSGNNTQFFRPNSDNFGSTTGPSSSYVFGDATAISSENPALRKILRSPSMETERTRATEGSEESRRPSTSGSESQTAGVKRKMSSESGEAQLAGPGVIGKMEVEPELPPPKRRGSAIDTSRIASLSLNDRRNSAGGHWAYIQQNELGRRNSTSSSIFSGYPPALSGPPAASGQFAWPANFHSISPDTMQHDAEASSSTSAPPMHMMPPISFNQDRRMSVPNVLSASPPTGPTRVLRSRSRPPSRQTHAENSQPAPPEEIRAETLTTKPAKESGATPYSRSPELRVSHKLAERKRRKEMKELFDELRDQLPADRGMKASKWEILSKAIDFVNQLKQSHQDMAREIDMLRHELDAARQNTGLGPFAGPPHVVYGPGPIPAPYPLPPGVIPHPHVAPVISHSHNHSPQPQSQQPQPPNSRPASSQNTYPPSAGGQETPQNGTDIAI